jgi:hypothetical protein
MCTGSRIDLTNLLLVQKLGILGQPRGKRIKQL